MKRVVVDAALCQGHNRCVDIAEDLFETDDEGFALVVGDGRFPTERLQQVGLAVANCPEQAISIVDEGMMS